MPKNSETQVTMAETCNLEQAHQLGEQLMRSTFSTEVEHKGQRHVFTLPMGQLSAQDAYSLIRSLVGKFRIADALKVDAIEKLGSQDEKNQAIIRRLVEGREAAAPAWQGMGAIALGNYMTTPQGMAGLLEADPAATAAAFAAKARELWTNDAKVKQSAVSAACAALGWVKRQ